MKKLFLSLLATLLMLAIVAPTPSEAAKFKDVKDSHSLQLEIEYLVSQGVISGYTDGTFKPNAKIAKKHVAAMLVKALKLPTDNVKNPGYKDVPTTHPNYKEIAAAYTAGLFGDATYFKPESTISRAFMAQLLTKGFKLNVLNNDNSFVDVKKSSSYYTAVQAVASNAIAKGSFDKNYNLRFEPNKTLSRGHFAAFLARAMTLKTGSYKPNTNYDYYFTYSTGYNTIYANHYDAYYGFDYWIEKDLKTGEEIDRSVYGINGNTWFEGVPESDVGTFVTYPFTIGLKYNYIEEDGPGGIQKVLDTAATVKVGSTTYTDVVIVEEVDYTYDDYNVKRKYFSRVYIAKDYGIIKSESGYVGQAASWKRELVKRELAN